MHYEAKFGTRGKQIIGQSAIANGRVLTIERQLYHDGRLVIRQTIAPSLLY
jgi:hypothetical protein